MFPLKTNIPVNKFSYGLWFIIAINTFVYIYFRINFYGLLFVDHGFMLLKLTMPSDIITLSEKMSSFITYMFIHSSLFHMVINMYFLYIFGRNVEDYIGAIKFICVYVILGVLAVVIEAFIAPDTEYPIVGSSGAIAGIMGMFVALFPTSKIKTFIFLLIYAIIRYIPAIVIIFLFMFFQLSLWWGEKFYNINEYLYSFQVSMGIKGRYISISHVAYWTHIGGFISGVIIGIIFKLVYKYKDKNSVAI